MQGVYAAKKVVVVAVFIFTMLLMKEVMDTLLPPPGTLVQSFESRSSDGDVSSESRQGERDVKPGAILDVEAVAEEEDMGPEVVDRHEGTVTEDLLGKGIGGQNKLDSLTGSSLLADDDKVLEDPKQVEEDDRLMAAAAQQGLPVPQLGTGADEEALDQGTEQRLDQYADKGLQQRPDQRLQQRPDQGLQQRPDQGLQERPNQGSPVGGVMHMAQGNPGQESPAFGPNYYTVYIKKSTNMDSVQIIPSGELIQLRVQACSDAYLVLKQKNMADEYSYHIGFGYGKKTVIWKQPPAPVTKEYDTPDSGWMACDKFTSYWVRQSAGVFYIGVEGEQGPFVQWPDPKPFKMNTISLATPHPKQTTVWHLDIKSVNTLRVDTGEDYSYDQLWVSTVGKNAVVLQVRACRDAHILLSDQEGEIGNVYEVAIGMADNSQTAIRESKFGPNMVSTETAEILSCEDTKAFWFTWTHQKLTVGRGTRPGNRVLVSHGKQDHPKEIRSVAMSTGWGATGRWLFNMDEAHLYPS